MATLTDINNDIKTGIAKVQSPYLYLQAAGNDGSDGHTDGISLAWDLMGSLDVHIPKGALAAGPGAPYPANYGFNKANDFVEVMRVPYLFQYPATVNFKTDKPTTLVETGPTRLWKFNTVVRCSPAGELCEIVIKFDNVTQYDSIRATINPSAAPYDFISHYSGILEASVTGKLCFAWTGSVNDIGGTARLRLEAISAPENTPAPGLFISCRKILRFSANTPAGNSKASQQPRPIADNTIELIPSKEKPTNNKIISENIVYFRFDYTHCTPLELNFETYEHFILGSANQKQPAGQWQSIGDKFSLSIQDNEIYDRLDNPTLNVDGNWPRFSGANRTSGLFTVNTQNYKAKWDTTLPPLNEPNDDNGLKRGVINYLRLSQQPTNPTAIDALPNSDPQDQSMFNISYLQMLKIVGLDHHVRRMLGLGHIDASPAVRANNAQFIYLSIYHTVAALETGAASTPATHLYMTLPTSRKDFRLPPPPVQEEPTFGITVDNGTGFPVQLTDVNGYAPFDDVRIINLNIQPFDTYQQLGPFFNPPVEFSSDKITKPVLYGVKYKSTNDPNYRTPEISCDSEFSDASGVYETAPIIPQAAPNLFSPAPPIYSHTENSDGNHDYAIYGVNWFSCVSALSNIKTVNTLIPKRNTLLPPANFAIQLIQPEDPLILTSALEQDRLAAMTGDQTLVRVTFDWNQNHYIPQLYNDIGYANKAQFFFRQEPPRAVQGKIKSIAPVLNTQFIDIRTQPYTNSSTLPMQTITPTVVAGDEPRFAGGTFASNQVIYVVESVSQSTVPGEGAIFRIKKQTASTVSELSNTNQFSASVNETIPNLGDRFMVTENMNNTANWASAFVPNAENTLAKEVDLVTFLSAGQLHAEVVQYADGTSKQFNIGGIYESAIVTERPDIYPAQDSAGNQLSNAGQVITNSHTGIYDITFQAYQLPPHPDPGVQWYKGTVRILENVNFLPANTAPNFKVLDVWRIDTSGNTLTLTVYDPTLDLDSNYQPQNQYIPIDIAGSINVNFHPGYRVYLTAQATIFNESTVYPGPQESSKQTIMACRSENVSVNLRSFLCNPVVLQSRKILQVIQPGLPNGPLYSTRTNLYGKVTWTMDVPVTANAAREPYGLVFYRANDRAILDALYKTATADNIMSALKNIPAEDAAFESNRWTDLVNVQNLDTDGTFKAYTTGGFRFPMPDNDRYFIPGTSISPFNPALTALDNNTAEIVKHCIQEAFLPLTESPVIYQFVKQGTQTSSRKPVTRNTNGDILPYNDLNFDPSPMAVKYTNNENTFVRFTDYSLDGTLTNIYFYYAVEMNDEMKFSTASQIAGPVKLVNTYPPEQPGIRKVTAVLEDPIEGVLPATRLEINQYLESENIKQVKLYRATNAADASSVRTMQLAETFNIDDPANLVVSDTFRNLDFPLFGDPLFYRVVALREIINEFGQQEYIPSKASDLGMSLLTDVINPPPPEITVEIGNVTSLALQNVDLKWNVTAYNATYYLYQMTATGNWINIFKIKSNDVGQLHFMLPSGLAKIDEEGRNLYYRFKVTVENASGLFNLTDNQITLPQ